MADSGLTPAAGESTPIAKEINAPVQRELTPGTKGEPQNLQNIFTTQILDRSYTTALLVAFGLGSAYPAMARHGPFHLSLAWLIVGMYSH